MNPLIDIFDGMIDNLMGVLGGEPFVGEQRIGVEGGTGFDMLFDFGLESGSTAVRNDSGANFATTLQQPHDGGFVFGSGSSDAALANTQVHVPRLTADEGLVRFHFTAAVSAQLHHGTILEGQPDTVHHEPCRLLSDAQRAGDLARTDAVLGAGDDPDGGQPLFQPEWGVLKDGSHLGGELPLGVGTLALPFPLVCQPSDIIASAGRAGNPVRPAMRHHVGNAVVRIGEVDDGFLQSARAVHAPRIRNLS